MTTDRSELPDTHKPPCLEDAMSEYAEYAVTLVKTTRYRCVVSAESPGEAATLVGDRARKGQLDGIEVVEAFTDVTVHRVPDEDATHHVWRRDA